MSALKALASREIRVSTSTLDRQAVARDLWPALALAQRSGVPVTAPEAVIWPADESAVQRVVHWARENRVTLMPRGAGTARTGASTVAPFGVMLDVKRLNRVHAFDEVARTVTVGAGLSGEALEVWLRARGFTLGWRPEGLRLASTVGGWLATGTWPFESLAQGPLHDALVGCRLIDGRGEAWSFTQADARWHALVLGAEGTLGVFTEATLRVQRRPEVEAWHSFEFERRDEALGALHALVDEGLRPVFVSVEPESGITMQHRESARSRGWFQEKVAPRLLEALARETVGRPALLNRVNALYSKTRLHLVLAGHQNSVNTASRNAVELLVKAGGDEVDAGAARTAVRQLAQAPVREGALAAIGTTVDEVAVDAPWSVVNTLVAQVMSVTQGLALTQVRFSVASTSRARIHFAFTLAGVDDREAVQRWRMVHATVSGAALQHGGHPWAQGGIGLKARESYLAQLGPARAALVPIKRALDPDALFAPGRLFT